MKYLSQEGLSLWVVMLSSNKSWRNDDGDVLLLLLRDGLMSCFDYSTNCAVSWPHDRKY
jgi:hypothetical protein